MNNSITKSAKKRKNKRDSCTGIIKFYWRKKYEDVFVTSFRYSSVVGRYKQINDFIDNHPFNKSKCFYQIVPDIKQEDL